MEKSTHPSSFLVISALIAVQVLFGLNYVFSKVVVDAMPPLVWSSFRMILAALIMLMVAFFKSKEDRPKGKAFFIGMIPCALLGVAINQSAFLMGLKLTTSSNAAILNTLIPLMTLMLVILRKQEEPSFNRIIGFFCAFLGVLVLKNIEDLHFSNQTFQGDLLVLLNCISFSCFLTFCKKFLSQYDQIWATGWLFLYGSIGITLLALPDWTQFVLPQMDATLYFSMAYALVGGTILPYFLSNWALKHGSSANVALFIYFQPVVAILLAWFWKNEPITLRMIISSFFIFIGLVFAVFKNTSEKKIFTHSATGVKS